jgi:thioesterase domain-containing protein
LFFFHGDYYGGGIYCRNLARHLGPEQGFYAIPPHGLDGGALPKTIEAMAADRLRALLAFRPTGPYLLGGFCWGGLVAVEMARQMSARGLDVQCVFVIDGEPRNTNFRAVRELIRSLGALFKLTESTEEHLFRLFRRIRGFVSSFGEASGIVAKCRLLVRKLLDHGPIGSEEIPTTIPHDRFSRWPIYHQITSNHVTGPYSGRVVLFRTNQLQSKHPNDSTAGWTDVASNVETTVIPGDHFTCITKHAEDLADEMRAFLYEA